MTILSSSSLFHYTKSFENLIGILENGFSYSGVREPYPQVGWGNDWSTRLGLQDTFVENHVVCFCDIPLSQAISHRKYYGYYAIGLSKEWAIQNNVAPVRYVHSNSPGFSGKLIEFKEIYDNQKDLKTLFVKEFVKHRTDKEIDIQNLSGDAKIVIKTLEESLTEALELIASSVPFFRAYEIDDPIKRTDAKRYYDEREWRAASKPPNNNLKFLWCDINFIICASRSECDALYKKLEQLKEILQINPVVKIWQKLFSFDEIETNF